MFSRRPIREKCTKQNIELHVAFMDLTKAFDTMSREGLWRRLKKFGCTKKMKGYSKDVAVTDAV